MPEYIELSRLKENLYREGCPVVVEGFLLTKAVPVYLLY